MYIYMGMFFNSPQDVPDFGSIKMYFVGTKELGYVEEGHKRFRKYAFQSTDLSKLSLITNAIDGSEAFAVDTGSTYVLYNNQWNIKSTNSNLAPEDMISIDYQVVQVLPNNGEKGIIYLIEHNMGEGNSFDEYIWVNDSFEKIGNTAIDLSGYMQKINISSNEQIGQIPKIKSDGNLESSGFTLNKSVPANAVFTDTTYNTVTQNADGLMSKEDKIKLDEITIANYIPKVLNKEGEVPKFDINGNIQSTGFTLGTSVPADAAFTDTTYENATTSVAGLLSPSDKIQLNNLSTNLNNKIDVSLKGTPNGVASLDSTGKIPSTQLPSYVDDVILGYYFEEHGVYGDPPQDFFYDENHTLITGESGKIYIDINTNKTYRYIGSNNNLSYNYTEISESLALGTTNSSAFYGDQGLAAYRHSNNINQSTGVAESIVDGGDAAALYKMKIYNNSGHIQTSSVSKATSSDITTLLGYTPINSNTKNVANGVAGLDSNSKISSSQLPGAILLENNTDLNTILTEGNYYTSPSITVTNAPENFTYFNLQVVRTSTNAWNQILTVLTKMYTRAWIKATNETPAHWTEWKEIISDTKVTQNTTPASGTFDLLMAKTASNHTAETDTINKSNTLNYNTSTKELYINSNRALTVADIVICTQSEYDALQTKTGLIYLIKEE